MDSIGLDWIGLDWIGLDWTRLDWTRLDYDVLEGYDLMDAQKFLVLRDGEKKLVFWVA